MTRAFIFFLLFIVFSFNKIFSQEQEFNSDFLFEDGIYLSLIDFVNNKPFYSANNTQIDFLEDGYTDYNMKKIKGIYHFHSKDSFEFINPEEIWGFSKDGKPYVKHSIYLNLSNSSIKRGFTRIQTIGSLCCLLVGSKEKQNKGITAGVMGAAFNYPNTIISDGIGIVINIKSKTATKLNLKSLKENIGDDDFLLKLIEEDDEPEKKLLYYVLKYNERHVSYILE